MHEGFLNAGGHKLFYRIQKPDNARVHSPYLIFLHEGLGCVARWKEFPGELIKTTALPGLLYDRYGYGKSEKLLESRHITFYQDEAQTLNEILDVLDIHEKVILFGHSDGATIALLFAAMFPQKVSGVICEAPHVFAEEKTLKAIRDACEAYEYGDLKSGLEKYHPGMADSVFYGWANTFLTDDIMQWSLLGDIRNIHCPLLLMQGVDDDFGTMGQLHAIASVVADAEVVEISGCGHHPHFEFPDVVLTRSKAFISKIISELG